MAGDGHPTTSPSNHEEHISKANDFVWFMSVSIMFSLIIKTVIFKLKIPIPYTTILLVFGFVIGVLDDYLEGAYSRTVAGLANINPHTLLLVFIPALVFESAFNADFHVVTRQLRSTLLLSGPGVVINAFLTALLVMYCLPYHWSFDKSLLFGSIVSATDPVAVVAILSELGASKKLGLLIEGESLLNDGSAFVLYVICLEFVKGNSLCVIYNILCI